MHKETILAIETSCDETAVAIVRGGNEVLANQVLSQMNLHAAFGGVVPEVASRRHEAMMPFVIAEAFKEAKCSWEDIDAIAVTFGPGLVGALLVGVSTAKALSLATQKPLIAVHHIEGHIYANFLAHHGIELPALCLVVSGGHTNLVMLHDHGSYENIACTRDDAAGEAFDKVARALGLGYPGGPKIDACSKDGDASKFAFPKSSFANSYDFSFSGLKSSVLNLLNQYAMQKKPLPVADVAASFQQAVVDVLAERTMTVLQEKNLKTLLLAGGVSANTVLRKRLEEESEKLGIRFYAPPLELCTDNAAMIGAAACYKYRRGEFATYALDAKAQVPFNEYVLLTNNALPI